MFDVYHTETELCLMSMLVLLTCVETFTEHQEEGELSLIHISEPTRRA